MISTVFKCVLVFGVGVYLIGSRLLKANTYLGATIIKETDPVPLKAVVYLLGAGWILLGIYCVF